MNFPIKIGITACGRPIVGAKCLRMLGDEIVATEKVYAVQIRHRCAALVNGRWLLLTPTEAKKRGATEVVRFS